LGGTASGASPAATHGCTCICGLCGRRDRRFRRRVRHQLLGSWHLRRTCGCAPAAGILHRRIYYHSPINGGGDVAIARQIPVAGVTTRVPSTLDIHIGVQNDLLLSIPSYVFATPVLGGQLQIGMLIPYGRNKVFVDQTIIGPMGMLGGPPMTSAGAYRASSPRISISEQRATSTIRRHATADWATSLAASSPASWASGRRLPM